MITHHANYNIIQVYGKYIKNKGACFTQFANPKKRD